MNKRIIVILCCIVFFASLIFVFRDNIVRLKLTTSLNYNEDVAYITIKDDFLLRALSENSEVERNNRGEIVINDKNNINKIINYLNSLKLIEDNSTEYESVDLDEVGYFAIGIFKVGYEDDILAFDLFSFMTDYVSFTPNKADWDSTRYYIKNSGYNSKTQSSKTYKFLYDLING